MSSNQSAAIRREKIGLGHSHLQVDGSLVAQSTKAQGMESGLAQVTQLTSITTTVPLTAPAGVITMFGVSTVGTVKFLVSSDLLDANSILLVQVQQPAAGNFVTASLVSSATTVGDAVNTREISVVTDTGSSTAPPKINYRIL